jgi:HlyD family secretion protein
MKKQFVGIIPALCLMLSACGPQSEETKPIRKDVTEMVFAAGVLEAQHTYNLTAQSEGYLTAVNFERGDEIVPGTVLAVIDNVQNVFNDESAEALYEIASYNTAAQAPALAQASHALKLAQQKMALDSVQWSRYKVLYEKGTVSKAELESYQLQFATSQSSYRTSAESYALVQQQAQQQLITSKASKRINANLSANNQIRAVVGGKVYQKLKQPGDFVRKGDAIATIGDAHGIYAKVNVDETNIHKVAVGQEAIVELNVFKGKTYRGRVAEIYPAFEEATQSFTCKIAFTDRLDFDIVGTQLQSNIIIGKERNALLIPRNYLELDGTVTRKKGNVKVPVETAFVSKDWVHLRSGIEDSDVLITQNLKANKGATSEMASQMR